MSLLRKFYEHLESFHQVPFYFLLPLYLIGGGVDLKKWQSVLHRYHLRYLMPCKIYTHCERKQHCHPLSPRTELLIDLA